MRGCVGGYGLAAIRQHSAWMIKPKFSNTALLIQKFPSYLSFYPLLMSLTAKRDQNDKTKSETGPKIQTYIYVTYINLGEYHHKKYIILT